MSCTSCRNTTVRPPEPSQNTTDFGASTSSLFHLLSPPHREVGITSPTSTSGLITRPARRVSFPEGLGESVSRRPSQVRRNDRPSSRKDSLKRSARTPFPVKHGSWSALENVYAKRFFRSNCVMREDSTKLEIKSGSIKLGYVIYEQNHSDANINGKVMVNRSNDSKSDDSNENILLCRHYTHTWLTAGEDLNMSQTMGSESLHESPITRYAIDNYERFERGILSTAHCGTITYTTVRSLNAFITTQVTNAIEDIPNDSHEGGKYLRFYLGVVTGKDATHAMGLKIYVKKDGYAEIMYYDPNTTGNVLIAVVQNIFKDITNICRYLQQDRLKGYEVRDCSLMRIKSYSVEPMYGDMDIQFLAINDKDSDNKNQADKNSQKEKYKSLLANIRLCYPDNHQELVEWHKNCYAQLLASKLPKEDQEKILNSTTYKIDETTWNGVSGLLMHDPKSFLAAIHCHSLNKKEQETTNRYAKLMVQTILKSKSTREEKIAQLNKITEILLKSDIEYASTTIIFLHACFNAEIPDTTGRGRTKFLKEFSSAKGINKDEMFMLLAKMEFSANGMSACFLSTDSFTFLDHQVEVAEYPANIMLGVLASSAKVEDKGQYLCLSFGEQIAKDAENKGFKFSPLAKRDIYHKIAESEELTYIFIGLALSCPEAIKIRLIKDILQAVQTVSICQRDSRVENIIDHFWGQIYEYRSPNGNDTTAKEDALEKLKSAVCALGVLDSSNSVTTQTEYFKTTDLSSVLKDLQDKYPEEYKIIMNKSIFGNYSKAAMALVLRLRVLQYRAIVGDEKSKTMSDMDVIKEMRDKDLRNAIGVIDGATLSDKDKKTAIKKMRSSGNIIDQISALAYDNIDFNASYKGFFNPVKIKDQESFYMV